MNDTFENIISIKSSYTWSDKIHLLQRETIFSSSLLLVWPRVGQNKSFGSSAVAKLEAPLSAAGPFSAETLLLCVENEERTATMQARKEVFDQQFLFRAQKLASARTSVLC